MLVDILEVSVYFGCFCVIEIVLFNQVLVQFDDSEILCVVELLLYVKVGSIVWNGIFLGWLGFDVDECLCCCIIEVIGILVCILVLVLNEIFDFIGVKCFGLVMFYLDDVQVVIIKNYVVLGLECVLECYLCKQDNFFFLEVGV